MTKRTFHFKLEPVRTLRENVEQTVMKELAGELRTAASLRQELGTVEERLAEARTPFEGGVTAAELAVRQAYVERMEREVAEVRHRSVAQETHVERTRRRLADAVRARQTLDRLEARRRAAHDLEQRRLERADGDEISLTSHRTAEHAA
jgi:flagellar export protein FliJ